MDIRIERIETPYHLCFETLGNELRMQILDLLRENAKSVSEISKVLGVERSRVSHSLKMLSSCSILEMRKKGKNNLYFIRDKDLLDNKENIFTLLDQHKKEFCGSCKKIETKK